MAEWVSISINQLLIPLLKFEGLNPGGCMCKVIEKFLCLRMRIIKELTFKFWLRSNSIPSVYVHNVHAHCFRKGKFWTGLVWVRLLGRPSN